MLFLFGFSLLRSQPAKFADRLKRVDTESSAFISRLRTWGSESCHHCCAFRLVHFYGVEVFVEKNNECGIPFLCHPYGSEVLSRFAVRQNAVAFYLLSANDEASFR